MKAVTPAIEIRDKDLAKNTEALGRLLAHLPSNARIKTIVDVRYGLGGWARCAVKLLRPRTLTGYELDTQTFLRAEVPTRGVCTVVNGCLNESTSCDLLLADFNALTALKRSELDEVLGLVDCKWLIFTDVASSKLHLNFRSYGLAAPDLAKYWNQFKITGFKLVAYERAHHHASSALFRRAL